MAQNYVSGYASYLNYGYEATYGTGVSGTRTFGHGNKISISRRNNTERIYGLGSRNPTTASALKYEGSATIEFIMSNASFFRGILGDVADAGAGPYTHTYTEINVLPSLTLVTGSEIGDNDEVSVLLGAKIGSASITATQGELVRVRLETVYKTETLATSGVGSQVAETETPFNFAHGTLTIGTTVNAVQSIELTVNHNLENLYGLGSRLLVNPIEKAREYNFRMNVAFNDVTTLLTKFLGTSSAPSDPNTPSPSATLVLEFSNGLSGTNERTIEMTFANLYLNEESLPKDVNEIIKEDVTGFALSCTSVVWTNNTATDDGSP